MVLGSLRDSIDLQASGFVAIGEKERRLDCFGEEREKNKKMPSKKMKEKFMKK